MSQPLADRPAFPAGTPDDGLTIRQFAELVLTAAQVAGEIAHGAQRLLVKQIVEQAQGVTVELLRHWKEQELTQANEARLAKSGRGRGWQS